MGVRDVWEETDPAHPTGHPSTRSPLKGPERSRNRPSSVPGLAARTSDVAETKGCKEGTLLTDRSHWGPRHPRSRSGVTGWRLLFVSVGATGMAVVREVLIISDEVSERRSFVGPDGGRGH